ncbi:ABC transporter ATP-binding protein [Aequorivita marina]|uniref:ABC transporter ATP-binding protein n=1 Tax=Aequorivita marina TaxID=3073654 RepID=UPI002876CEC2|nr:ABC transporter ATP-binding protein [Aequorivita sp. S2608]MDS1299062.1 ABC transporter ATP-binding protein [Aequorivita sp. S2608]
MSKSKGIFKEYTSGFSFFYAHLRNKVFLILLLSVLISVLDALGLSMFLPLLQVLNQEGGIDASSMGKLGFLVEGLQNLGISLSLTKIILVMLAFFIIKGVVKYFANIYFIVLQQAFIRKMRMYLLKGLNQISFKQFMLTDSGRIQNTLSGEVDRVSNAFTTYFGTLRNALMALVYLGFAFLINPGFALLVIIFGVISHFLFRMVYSRTRKASRGLTNQNHVFQGQIIQHVAHFKYLRSTGMIDKFTKKLEETIVSIEASRKRLGMLSSIGGAVVEPAVIVVLAIVMWVQFYFFGGTLSTAMVSLLFFYRALTSLIGLQAQWNTFLKVSGSLENIESFSVLLEQHEFKDGTRPFKKFTSGIAIEDLNFAYGTKPILKNIDLQISKNESLAFVGESGSGKTTLISLITGLLNPDSGSIKVEGVALNEFQSKSYQKRIGYVSQDPVIFDDTLFNNVTFWAPKTPENQRLFEESIRKASLKEFMDELEGGENAILGNNGINLSGGQRQRVSIARELYKDIDVLILDEATSALDSETENAIQSSIEALQGKYTILIVAHRLSTIRNTDRIVFMDKGAIIDVDSFNNLIQKQDRFRRMVELQEL